MSELNIGEDDVYRFIFNQIDTVPHMEALLLLWNTRPQKWTDDEVSHRLYLDINTVRNIMQNLARRRLITAMDGEGTRYCYESKSEESDALLELVAATYRRDLVRISNFIHSKASAAVREFARAFKFTKDSK